MSEPASKPPEPPLPEYPEHLRPGRLVEVAPGVTRIIAPNPSMMTGPGTNTYLIGPSSGPLALVDPGPDDDAHLAALCDAAGDRLRWIFVTHTHIDHAPLAARLKEVTGAEIMAFGPAPANRLAHPRMGALAAAEDRGSSHQPADGDDKRAEFDPHDGSFAPDRLMVDGQRLDGGDFAVEAVYTPGHTSNHLCFELAGTGLLFSGDHVMSGSTVVIGPPDGDMAVYLESLEKVKARAPRRIAPGHGDVIEDPAAVLDDYLRHRTERERQVLAGLRSASDVGVTAEKLVESIYKEVPEALHPVARLSVWAHLRKLGAEGLASTPDPDDPAAPWFCSP